MGKVASIRQLRLPATDPMAARTHVFVAELLTEAGASTGAETHLAIADLLFDDVVPPDPTEHGKVLLRLADAYVSDGSPEEAAKALVKANGILARVPADDSLRLEVELRAGQALRLLGRPSETVRIASEALAALAAVDEDDTPAAAPITLELGEARFAVGDYDGARAAYLAAITAVEAAAEPDEGLRLRIVASMADLSTLIGDRAGAIALLAEALAGADRASLPDMIMARHRLAGLLLEDGRNEEALAEYRKVLAAIDELGLDEAHDADARASVLVNSSRALLAIGEKQAGLADAGKAYALSGLTGTAGTDRLATILAYATALAANGRLDDAESAFTEAATLVATLFQPGHRVALATARDVGGFYLRDRHEVPQALAVLRAAAATFAPGAAPADGSAGAGYSSKETRGEIAKLLVAGLWQASASLQPAGKPVE